MLKSHYQDEDLTRRVIDRDGISVPPLRQANMESWYRMSVETRRAMSAKVGMEKIETEPVQRSYAPNFSTDYAKDYARLLGWKVTASERYDFRLKRLHDLLMQMDLECETPQGIVSVQAACPGTRAAHRAAFDAQGGIERAKRLRRPCVFWEFERSCKVPVFEDWWVSIADALG